MEFTAEGRFPLIGWMKSENLVFSTSSAVCGELAKHSESADCANFSGNVEKLGEFCPVSSDTL